MIRLRKIFPFVAAVALLATSCHRDVFDEDYYKKLVEEEQPVKNIDPSHTWDLTSRYYMTVTRDVAKRSAHRLQILTGNPTTDEECIVLGDYLLDDSEKSYFAFVAPNNLKTFYAALIDDNGKCTVTSFTSDNRSINFSNPLATNAEMNTEKTSKQTFSYCFEDEMPQPGDYDYNDVVLRVSQERTAANQMTFDVTLAAVGSLTQVAAAIRLVGYGYDNIESVTTIPDDLGENFYKADGKSYRKTASLPFIDSEAMLVRGMNGEAVLNLFEDAHWATGYANYTSEGYIHRYRYNVSAETGEDDDQVPPRTISYVVTFKNPNQLDYFTLGDLDPFLVVEYNGVFMENHAVYKHKAAAVLHEYVQPTSAVILPWALTVPSAGFRYPLNGQHIGYANDSGALFGAYMTEKHAFGEWARNANAARDWYFYPTTNMVY